jgi:hypothetical protein
MTSPAFKKFRVSIQIVEDYSAVVAAKDLASAREQADNLFSACNIDGFELENHTFEIRDVEKLAPYDPTPVANDWVLS